MASDVGTVNCGSLTGGSKPKSVGQSFFERIHYKKRDESDPDLRAQALQAGWGGLNTSDLQELEEAFFRALRQEGLSLEAVVAVIENEIVADIAAYGINDAPEGL